MGGWEERYLLLVFLGDGDDESGELQALLERDVLDLLGGWVGGWVGRMEVKVGGWVGYLAAVDEAELLVGREEEDVALCVCREIEWVGGRDGWVGRWVGGYVLDEGRR